MDMQLSEHSIQFLIVIVKPSPFALFLDLPQQNSETNCFPMTGCWIAWRGLHGGAAGKWPKAELYFERSYPSFLLSCRSGWD